MTALKILPLIVLIPLVLYIREQTYRNAHGNSTIGRDIENLLQSFNDRRERRKLRNKYKHLNKLK